MLFQEKNVSAFWEKKYVRFRKSGCNHEKERGHCLQPIRIKESDILKWKQKELTLGATGKQSFPQIISLLSLPPYSDKRCYFSVCGFGFFQSCLYPATCAEGYVICNLQTVFLSAPSFFIGFKTQQGLRRFPERILVFPYFFDHYCTNKTSSDGTQSDHCWPLPTHFLITSQEFYKGLLFHLRGWYNSTLIRKKPRQNSLGFCTSKGKKSLKRTK